MDWVSSSSSVTVAVLVCGGVAIYVPIQTYGHKLTERLAPEIRFLRRVVGLTLPDRVRCSTIQESLGI